MHDITLLLNDSRFKALLGEEDNLQQFDKLTFDGLIPFLQECSRVLSCQSDKFSDNDLIFLFFILRYLHDNWKLHDKKSRQNKQVCIRALFLVLFKNINKRKLILEEVSALIEASSSLRLDDFPFLSNAEKEQLDDQLSIVAKEQTFPIYIPPTKFVDQLDPSFYPYILPVTARKLDVLYYQICKFSEKIDQHQSTAIQIKTVFSGILGKRFSCGYPEPLEALTLAYFCSKAEQLVSALISSEIHKNSASLNSFRVSEYCEPTRNLFVQDSSGMVQPIPFWAAWFCEAGAKVAAASQVQKKIFVGFSLPARAYAALFFLVGYQVWMQRNVQIDAASYKGYFASLSKCDPGTPLLIWDKKRWKRCFFESVELRNSCRLLKVKVPGTKESMYWDSVPENMIYKIRPAVDPKRKVGNRQVGFSMKGHAFLMKFYKLSDLELIKYLINTYPDNVIVGSKLTLQKEIEGIQLFSEKEKGSLQDILRIKNFMSEFTFPKSEILSSQKSIEKYPKSTGLLIFDGSRNFLKYQAHLKSPVEIVFLDRTENYFSDATGELMERYYNRESELSLFKETPLPIEIITFTE